MAAIALASLAILAAGCGDSAEPVAGISDSTYVEVMARLVRIDASTTLADDPAPAAAAAAAADSALPGASRDSVPPLSPADSARAAVLDSFAVDPDSLLRYAAVVGANPERMTELWLAISAKVDTLAAADSAAAADSLAATVEAADGAAGTDSPGAAVPPP